MLHLRYSQVIVCALILLSLTRPHAISAGEPTAKSYFLSLLEINIPDIIAKLPEGNITKKELIAATLKYARQNIHPINSIFLTPERIIPYILQKKQAAKNPERLPDKAQLHEFCAKWQKIKKDSLNKGITSLPTDGDALRDHLRLKLTEATGIDPVNIAQFETNWRGLNQKIVANIEGRDYTEQELAQYLLTWCGDEELKFIIDSIFCEKVIRSEAKKMDITTDGLSTEQVLKKMYAPFISPRALGDYYQSEEEHFKLIKLKLFIFNFRSATKPVPSTAPQTNKPTDSRETALSKAVNQEKALKNGNKPGDPEKITSQYLYICADAQIADKISPEAYGIDYIYSDKGSATSPLKATPFWLKGITELINPKPGLIIGPLTLGNSFVVCEVIRTYQPRNITMLQDFLTQKRLQQEKHRLLYAIKNITHFNFTPESRLPSP